MASQRDSGQPAYLHRREWFSRLAVKLLGDSLGSDLLDPMSVEDKLYKQLNSGTIAAQDLYGQNASTPTPGAGANAGTSPPAPVLGAGSTDTRGSVTFGTGTTPAAGALCVVNFGVAYPFGVVVQLTPTTSAAANLMEYVTANQYGFTINTQVAPAASQANTVYGFNYRVL